MTPTRMQLSLKRSSDSYLEQLDRLLAARICIVWANTGKSLTNNGGTKITPASYLLGLIDGFGAANKIEAARECSFLLELYHTKLQEQQR